MKDSITAANIIGWLDRNGPKIPLSDKPLFKLIWTDDEREKRIGTYRIYAGDVFVREETKLDIVLKYNYLPQRWILEKWFPPEVAFNPELPDSVHGVYEPVFAFDKHGRELPLKLEVVQIIVSVYNNQKGNEMLSKSYSQANKEEAEKRAYNRDLDILMDEGPLVSQFHDGSAIIMPGDKKYAN